MNLKSALPRKSFLIALGLLLPAVAPAAAVTIDGMFLINDLTDVVSITDITPGGPTGRLNACTPAGETCSFSIVSSQGVLPATFFPGLNMLEQGTGLVSDTLQQTDTGGTSTFWQFVSDSESPLAGLGGSPNSFTEDGTAQSAAILIYGTTGHGDQIFIQSDVEAPESSTAVLALLGFAALGVVLLRRRFASRVA